MKYVLKGLYVEITSECNLYCKHCYNNSGNKKKNLDYATIINLKNELKRYNIKSLSISGGEPLMHERIIDILQYALEMTDISLSIITNGTLITENMLAEIPKSKRITVQISLDGIGNVHDFLRGDSAFSRLLSAVDLINKNNIDYYFHSVLFRKNIDQIGEMVRFAKEHKAKSIVFTYMHDLGRFEQNRSSLYVNPTDLLKAFDEIDHIKNTEKGIDVGVPKCFYGTCSVFPVYANANSVNTTNIVPRIDVDGNVYPCQLFTDHRSIIGNINNEDLFSVMENGNLEKLYELIKKEVYQADKCISCISQCNCLKGCPGIELDPKYINTFSMECQLRIQNLINKLSETKKGMAMDE